MVRIAICDDEKEAVMLHEEIIKDSLQSCGIGYEITTYTYSSNLLSDIAEDRFFYDLLLLDIEMPDVTGMELSKKIKPFLPNIKVIFITSHSGCPLCLLWNINIKVLLPLKQKTKRQKVDGFTKI